MRETVNDVSILRTYMYVPKNPRTVRNRILFDMSFTLSSLLGSLASGPCDMVIVISPPLQLGVTGWMLGLLKRAPFFFHIKDLVPDAAVATGMMEEGSSGVRIAHALERFVYKRACGVGVICDGFARNLMGKGVPREKIAILPDYIDLDFVAPMPRNNGFRAANSIGADEFLVMYSGSIALKQGLDTFVEAAAEFTENDGAKFYLVGEGPYREG